MLSLLGQARLDHWRRAVSVRCATVCQVCDRLLGVRPSLPVIVPVSVNNVPCMQTELRIMNIATLGKERSDIRKSEHARTTIIDPTTRRDRDPKSIQ